MRVEVTQEDIDNGKPFANTCPIALAIKRTLKPGLMVSVTLTYASVTGRNFWKRYFLPDEATTFVGHFDRGEPVEPLTFETGFEYNL